MAAILRAEVDLIWFGGIGTFIKSSAENHAEVGDRSNDAHRIDGDDIRAGVVGEGANLGVTQRGRVEYRSEEHPSALQSLMRISYAVLCLNKKPPVTRRMSAHKDITQ